MEDGVPARQDGRRLATAMCNPCAQLARRWANREQSDRDRIPPPTVWRIPCFCGRTTTTRHPPLGPQRETQWPARHQYGTRDPARGPASRDRNAPRHRGGADPATPYPSSTRGRTNRSCRSQAPRPSRRRRDHWHRSRNLSTTRAARCGRTVMLGDGDSAPVEPPMPWPRRWDIESRTTRECHAQAGAGCVGTSGYT